MKPLRKNPFSKTSVTSAGAFGDRRGGNQLGSGADEHSRIRASFDAPQLSESAPGFPPSGFSARRRRSFAVQMLLNLSVFTGTLVVLLVGAEIVFRYMTRSNLPTTSARLSDRPRFFLLPEESTDNRDYVYPPKKAPGTFRIIVIGDSFTFGGKVPFDDTFPKRLERMLQLNTGHRPVEVLNWGVPGLSTRAEELGVRRALRHFEPDLLILQITLNDPELKPYDGHLAVSPKWINAIDDYWRSGAYVAHRIVNTVNQRAYNQYFFDLFEKEDTAANFRIGLRQIAERVSEAKVPLLAVTFPIFSHPIDARYPFAPLHQRISDSLAQSGLAGIDLLSWYSGLTPERLAAVPGSDPHPNEIAHRIAAEAIYDALRERKLLPEDLVAKNSRSHRPLRGRYPVVHDDDDNAKRDKEESHDDERVGEADLFLQDSPDKSPSSESTSRQ